MRKLFLLLSALSLQANMYHNQWEEENIAPFSELMLSWNGSRPELGKYQIYVRVKLDDWSNWLPYASWGSKGQSSYLSTASEMPVRVYQDALEVKEGRKATGFQVKIEGEGGALPEALTGLHIYTNGGEQKTFQTPLSSVYLPVPGLSQMALNHVRNASLCSATSTTAVVRYLSQCSQIDPCEFAHKVWDQGFDIYGNWVFNVAQASVELGPFWSTWVERLSGFDAIYSRLSQGTPVVVSVRGPLPGSAAPYAEGHLIAVIGYDAESRQVICMDPAFPTDSQTHVRYQLEDFIQAWDRRGRVAYVFEVNR